MVTVAQTRAASEFNKEMRKDVQPQKKILSKGSKNHLSSIFLPQPKLTKKNTDCFASPEVKEYEAPQPHPAGLGRPSDKFSVSRSLSFAGNILKKTELHRRPTLSSNGETTSTRSRPSFSKNDDGDETSSSPGGFHFSISFSATLLDQPRPTAEKFKFQRFDGPKPVTSDVSDINIESKGKVNYEQAVRARGHQTLKEIREMFGDLPSADMEPKRTVRPIQQVSRKEDTATKSAPGMALDEPAPKSMQRQMGELDDALADLKAMM